MKVLVGIAVVLIVAVGLFFVFSEPSDTAIQEDEMSSETLSSFEAEVSSGVPLIDVRTPEEFSESHIQGALSLPLDTIKAGTLPDAQKGEKIYVYCRSGNRSAEAKQLLVQAGYTNIVDLGGINEVVALGGKKVK